MGRAGVRYRADIDGLRALAVVAVVLFHLDLAPFAGGYVGVDVFFVISGFLITSIVARKVEHGTFRLRDFYVRRVRRLVPALLATVVATTVAAAVVMLPLDFAAYARSAVAAVLSVANVVFFAEAGYWDSSTDLKPLLHTWSLGVEEQFYLFWPLLVIGLMRLRRRVPVAVSTAVLLGISLAGALWLFAISPEAAFYLLPARVWQFAVGALVGQLSQPWLREQMAGRRGTAATLVGVAMVLLSVVVFDAGTPFPGVAALLPSFGTVPALAGGVGGTGALVSAVLENPAARWLGRVSYALYLVHWPVISLYRYATDVELGATEQLLLAAAMIPLTLLLHHGVERRFYRRADDHGRGRAVPERVLATRVLSVSGVVAIVLVHPWLGDGWEWRTPDAVLTTAAIEDGIGARFDLVESGCSVATLGDPGRCDRSRPVQVLVLGNSHEPDGYNFLVGAYGDRDDLLLVSFGTVNGCGLVEEADGWTAEDGGCRERIERLFSELLPDLDGVVYTANKPFAANKDVLLAVLRSMVAAQPSLRVVSLGGYINTEVPCARLVNETGTSRACARPENVTYAAAEPAAQPLFDEFMAITDLFVDRRALLCTEPDNTSTCRTEASNGVPMSWDEHHLSLDFALEAGQLYVRRGGAPLVPAPGQ